MNNHYTYFLILVLSLAGPLMLSFDKKVAFYTKWKWLFPSMLLPAVFYVIWDMWFTKMGVWSFNSNFIIQQFVYNLPIEEVLFFFIVPYCCVFIYECVIVYFPAIRSTKSSDRILQLMGIILFLAALIFYKRQYTFYTFLFNSIFILLLFRFRSRFKTFNTSVFLISYLIILVPFLIVNGFLTAIPVVEYNSNQNLGIRIYTIPMEDVFYGMLLFMMNIAAFKYKSSPIIP